MKAETRCEDRERWGGGVTSVREEFSGMLGAKVFHVGRILSPSNHP